MRPLSIRFDPYLILLSALAVFALAPLLAPGYFFSAHDGRHSVFYVAMFDEAIQSGALWPRWAMHHNQGYGYPTFVVQAPLAFYVAEAFILLGAGVTQAVKLAWAVGYLGGAWGMYALVRYWLVEAGCSRPESPDGAGSGDAGGGLIPPGVAGACALVAGLLYTYAPYHLLDMYVRAALAETMLMGWFPWVFLTFDRLIRRGSAPGWQGRLVAAALSYSALLLTHSFAFVAFTPLLVGFVLFRLAMAWWSAGGAADGGRGAGLFARGLFSRIGLAAGAGIAAVLMAAIFLFPLFAEGPVLVQEDWTRDTYHYSRHWVYWGQLFSPFWGYGYSDDAAGANDGMGFQIGVLLLLLALVAGYQLVAAVTRGRGETSFAARWADGIEGMMLFLLVASLVVVAMVSPGAEMIWGAVPLLAVIQFPWRLLSLVAFTLAALGGLVVWQMVRNERSLLYAAHADAGVVALAILVCFAGVAYARPNGFQPVEPWREDGRAVAEFEREHPDMIASTQFVEEKTTHSPMTETYLAPDFTNDALPRLGILEGEGEVIRSYSGGHAFGGEVDLATPATVQIRLYMFPGWQVRVDGERVEYRVSPPHGLMEVDVPAGRHQIDVWMGTTPAMRAGAATAAVTLLALAGLWVSGYWTRREETGS